MPPLFITPLFTIAKIWKQPKCPLTDKWIKRIWNIDTMEYYSAMKKKNAICSTWIQLKIITLIEVSQKQTNTTRYHLHVKSKI